MKGVTAAQLRKIHACARECGMDNDLLHIAVRDITGCGSLKELTAAEACRVIDTMEGKRTADRRKMPRRQNRSDTWKTL